MTTEDDFHAHLDAHIEDYTCRLVFADFLEESDDEKARSRAAGYRALGTLRVWPYSFEVMSRIIGGNPIVETHWAMLAPYQYSDLTWSQYTLPLVWYSVLDFSYLFMKKHHTSRRKFEDYITTQFDTLSPRNKEVIMNTPPVHV